MWQIWVRDSVRAKWRMLRTRDFSEYWESDYFIDKNVDLGKEGEAVSLQDGETPWITVKHKHVG